MQIADYVLTVCIAIQKTNENISLKRERNASGNSLLKHNLTLSIMESLVLSS